MKLSRTVAMMAVVALWAIPAHAQESGNAWSFPDFSAVQVFESPNYAPMKVYRSGSSVRIDMNAAMTTLFVRATSKVYDLTVYPDGSRGCIVMKPDQPSRMAANPLRLLFGANLKRTPAGEEVVEGHHCKVENVSTAGPDGKIIQSKVWEADDLQGVPVKIESQLSTGFKLIVVHRNIVLGTPDKTLFTPPTKCTPYEKMWQVAPNP